MSRLIFSLLFVTGLILSGCSQPKSSITQTRPALSATEEFHLRGECVNLADQVKKLRSYPQNEHIEELWSSNYNVHDNRCYVLERVTEDDVHDRRNLVFDGQTKDLVADTSMNVKTGESAGDIWVDSASPSGCSSGKDCYAAALKYINECMQSDIH